MEVSDNCVLNIGIFCATFHNIMSQKVDSSLMISDTDIAVSNPY